MAEQLATPAPYVFLSYASAEQERALALADALQQAGIRSWIDRHAIAGGSAWSTAIVRGIKGCTVFVVLGSKRAFRSPNVQRELNLAVEENRPVLPLLLEQVTAPDDVRYALAGQQWVLLLDRTADVWLPEVLRALAGLGLVAAPPPPEAEPAAAAPIVQPPTNLPTSLTSFLGREQELAEVAQLLAHNRLVTLTGPGGTGKTRLALSAAFAQLAAFPDGVFFVDLAPLADPMLVPSAVAQALGLQVPADLPARDSVLRFLRNKRLLLVLDNFEHLLDAAEFVGACLQAAPRLACLVTSRAPLRVPGEREYPLAPLPLPNATEALATVLAQNPAVALFAARARDVRPDFVLTDANAAAVAAICARLDGLPLAIELAAARVRALPPAALLARLEQRLPLLTGGARTVPARQQTLRDTIAWSYALLEAAEQRLFRRLGLFAGGSTLELAEAVCNVDGDLGIDVLDGVSSLLEKSLLREVDGQAGEARYRMLETIREFALGELETSGEAEAVRRHFAEQLLQRLEQYDAARDWARLDTELDNARAVLGWCVEHAALTLGVAVFWALGVYLLLRGGGKEREVWRQRLLAMPDAGQPGRSHARLLARPLLDHASAAVNDHAAVELEEAVGLSRQIGDTECLPRALSNLAYVRMNQGTVEAAVPLAEEAVACFLELDAAEWAATPRNYLFQIALTRGDIGTAEALVALQRTVPRTASLAVAAMNEALLAEAHGDNARARLLWEEAVLRHGAQEGENSLNRLMGLAHLARFRVRQGDVQAAVDSCNACLAVLHRLGPARALSPIMQVLAQAAERHGLPTVGVRLLAAGDKQRMGFALEAFGWRVEYHATVDRLRAALGEPAFAEAWSAGAALSPDAAIELGLTVVAELQQHLAANAPMEHQAGR